MSTWRNPGEGNMKGLRKHGMTGLQSPITLPGWRVMKQWSALSVETVKCSVVFFTLFLSRECFIVHFGLNEYFWKRQLTIFIWIVTADGNVCTFYNLFWQLLYLSTIIEFSDELTYSDVNLRLCWLLCYESSAVYAMWYDFDWQSILSGSDIGLDILIEFQLFRL